MMTLNDRLWSLSAAWEARAHADIVASNADGAALADIRKAWAMARRNDAAELRMILREYRFAPTPPAESGEIPPVIAHRGYRDTDATKNPAEAGSLAPALADRESA